MVCIGCTSVVPMRANGSLVVRGNAEFFGCGMRKIDKG